jgi:hypothetical protein
MNRSISQHGRARPLAVEIGQRWFALALFLCAGSIATHGDPNAALTGSGFVVAPFIS